MATYIHAVATLWKYAMQGCPVACGSSWLKKSTSKQQSSVDCISQQNPRRQPDASARKQEWKKLHKVKALKTFPIQI